MADGSARRGTAPLWAARCAEGRRPADVMDRGVFQDSAPSPAALLAACRQRAAEARREGAQVTEALAGTWRGTLTDRQRAQLGNMLRRLIAEIEASLHHELARVLEQRDDLPREAVAAFATALPGGAYERLAHAGELTEPLLIEAALHRMFEHMLETALRPSAVETWPPNDDVGVLSEIAARPTNRPLAEALAGYAVARAQRVDAYGEPVLSTEELDAALAERLHWRVAAVLRSRAAEMLSVPAEAIDAEVHVAARAVLDGFASRWSKTSSTLRAVAALAQADVLDGALVLDALRRAEVPLFTALFAALTRLRPRLLRRLVFEPDGLGLAIVARAAGMTVDQFGTIYRLTRHARTPARAGAPDDLNVLAAFFEHLAIEDASRVCDYWRLPADYLDAIWRIGGGTEERNAGRS